MCGSGRKCVCCDVEFDNIAKHLNYMFSDAFGFGDPTSDMVFTRLDNGYYKVDCPGFSEDDISTEITGDRITVTLSNDRVKDDLAFGFRIPNGVKDINISIENGQCFFGVEKPATDINVNIGAGPEST